MRATVEELQSFYASAEGRRVSRAVRDKVAHVLPENAGGRVLGIGYACPFLAARAQRDERVIQLMPARQGVHAWPNSRANAAVMADELSMPFPDSFFDLVVCAHALEFIDPARRMIRELWRILAPGGQLLIIVANRAGVWTHFETTPFGNGRPFGRRQLEALLRDGMFEPRKWDTALVMPPVKWLMPLERAAEWFWPEIGGILLVEAEKSEGPRPVTVGKAALAPAGAGAIG